MSNNDQSISIGGDVTGSNVIVGGSNNVQNIQGVSAELFAQYAGDLKVTNSALSSFFKILQQQQVGKLLSIISGWHYTPK
ncbi:hypothetical protein [Candidatus Albibeggiatoa sp. nov. BB20]|uniref:hypothetical protein n=1 Tax=Candidatus Albibeggiatoa sp. nov. BB20 TaxID=3162723 RepID=UPI0033658129